MSYLSPHATPPPRLVPSASRYKPCAEHIIQVVSTPFVEKWITNMRPLPQLRLFPDELILKVGSWCLDPRALLELSSTCKGFARLLRTNNCWLDHHWGRGYDIGILTKKVQRAATAPEQQYGPDGWGLLVKSAFDKAEFPDDEYMTQWRMGKPTPHIDIQASWGLDYSDAFTECQPRGVKFMQVMFDILTEHECYNLQLYPWLNDEALKIRVKDINARYLQALISASDLLITVWAMPIAVLYSKDAVINNQTSLSELPKHDHRKTSITSLTYTFLVANKLMQHDDAQIERKLFPHTPMGPDIWQDENGDIDPKGLGWLPKVQKTWKGRVYVVGQYVTISRSNKCPAAIPILNRAPMRMCLDFLPNGEVSGRGGDYWGKFLITGTYKKTFVDLRKEYQDEEDEVDVYLATGHMIPWGIYGRWTVPEEPKETMGYWCIWHYEGAPKVPISVPVDFGDDLVYVKREPYKVNPNWFAEYEQKRDAGTHREPMHGWFTNPPLPPEKVELPKPDAEGF